MNNSLPLSQKNQLPNICAVYFILDDNGIVLYVGATQTLKRRLTGSHHRGQAFTDNNATVVQWREVDFRHLANEEARAIKENCPVLNREMVGYSYKRAAATVDVHVYFPIKVLAELRKCAKINRRSVTAETVVAVEEYVARMREANGQRQEKGK